MINHSDIMQSAIQEALKALQKDEVPIGAVLIDEKGKILSSAHNQTISLSDPTAHAEISALRQAGVNTKNYRLLNTVLYVTIEPCIMCMGAIIHARISKLVFGANDPKWGACGSLYDFSKDTRLNHKLEIISGICENECSSLIKNFFKEKRRKKNKNI